MKIVHDLVKGPFKNEAAFKAAVLKEFRRIPGWVRFELENEEKEPGMPDTLSVAKKYPAFFTEFKITDANGTAAFQKTQPLFYRKYAGEIAISILVWDRRFDRVVAVDPKEVVSAKTLRLRIPEELQ